MKEKANKILFILLAIFQFIITFFSERLFFDFSNINLINYFVCKFIVMLVIILQWHFLYKMIIKKDKKTRGIIKYSLVYFIVLLFVIFITWPGIWAYDDQNFLALAKTANGLYMLSYLTSYFYIVSLMLIPIPTAVAIFEALGLSLVIGYFVYFIKDRYKTKFGHFFIYIPFIMPITICYAIYPNRPTIYAIFFVWFFVACFEKIITKEKILPKQALLLLFLGALISNWRSETIYFILIVPLFISIINKEKILYFIKLFSISIVLTTIIWIPHYLGTSYKESNYSRERKLPMIINPLSYMLTQELKGSTIDNDIKAIDKVLDVSLMIKYPSLDNVPSTWMGPTPLYRSYTAKEYENMLVAYKNIIKNNFSLYIKCKLITFERSIGVVPNNMKSANFFVEPRGSLINTFLDDYYLTKPISEGWRQRILGILEGSDSRIYNIYPLFNNFIYPLIGVFIIFLLSIKRKNLIKFLLSGLILGQTFIMFLVSPASFFMYYYPLYLISWLLILILSFNYYYERRKTNEKN